jgi:hypothetical protein
VQTAAPVYCDASLVIQTGGAQPTVILVIRSEQITLAVDSDGSSTLCAADLAEVPEFGTRRRVKGPTTSKTCTYMFRDRILTSVCPMVPTS